MSTNQSNTIKSNSLVLTMDELTGLIYKVSGDGLLLPSSQDSLDANPFDTVSYALGNSQPPTAKGVSFSSSPNSSVDISYTPKIAEIIPSPNLKNSQSILPSASLSVAELSSNTPNLSPIVNLSLSGKNSSFSVGGANIATSISSISSNSLGSSGISANALSTRLAPHVANRLIVKFKPGAMATQVNQLKTSLGVISSKTISLTGAQIWNLSGNVSVEQALAAQKSNPLFAYIEPDYIVTKGALTPKATLPNDPGFNQLWGLNNTGQSGGTPDADIDAPEAWDIQKGNPNLVIGVIDTGVDYNHPDLVGNIWTNPGEIAGDGIDNDSNGYIDDIRGWDFAYDDNNPSDVDGHGTHVAGTIAGKGNNGVGVTGVAWNAKIMPLKFLDDTGSGTLSDAILAIDYATAKGVKLTNNSWGGGGFSQALYDSINAAGQQGKALFIAAAGNSSVNADINPMYPAGYNLANIVSVASTTRTDSLSYFSNYGLTSVDLGAPGSDIYSLAPNGGYATLSGTSMASPHVAGAAALLWSQNPTWTAQQVKAALMNTGDSIAALAGKTVSGKRLNVFNALAAANLPSVTVSVSPTSVQEDGATNLVYTFTRSNLNLSSPLTVNFGVNGTANAAPVGSDPADYTVLTNGSVTFNPTTKLGTVTFAAGATTATVVVDPIADTVKEDSESVNLTISSGTGYIGGSPNTATGTIISEEVFTNFFSDDFATNTKGWTLGTEWQIGAAKTSTGHIYGNPDPGTDNTPTADNGVAGVVIGGNASTAVHGFYYLTSPTINTNSANKLFFEYARWLNSDYTPYMQNTVDVFNGSSWINLWSSGGSPGTTDNAWTPQKFDISTYKSATTQIRFGFNVGSGAFTVSSWNVDDVKIYGDGGSTLPVVTVVANDPNAGEPANPGQYTLTRTGSLTSALTVNIAMSGTALNGADYATIPTTVTFAANSSTAVVNLNVIDDPLVEGTETATLTVLGGSGYTPGSLGNSGSAAGKGNVKPSSSATVSIADNDTGGTITLNAADTGWYDSTGFHSPGNTNYLAGDDNIANGKLHRNWFTFNLPTLTAPIIGAQLKVKTFDYDSPQTSETYELRDVTTAVPTLTAGGSGKTAIYADLGDGAIYGSQNYTNANDNQFITITLNAAAISALTAKSGQAFALGGLLTTLDTIDNSEYVFGFSSPVPGDVQLILNTGTPPAPVVTLASNYSGVSENSKTNLVYTFNRTGNTTSSLTVNFGVNGTAINGNDYVAYGGAFPTPTQGTITFAAGAATAQLVLITSGDAVKESNETIALTLASGTGYTIGTPAAVTTTILNDDGLINQQGTTGNDVIEAGTTRNLSGRAGNDILIGSNTGDMLVGGAGNDTITSGAGFDTIAYSFATEGGDTIKDFNVFQDTLQVSAAGFGGGLTAGESIANTQFVLGTIATTTSHRFIFNKPTGQLFFDVDGNGSGVAQLLANLTPNLNLTEDNIFAV